MAAAAPDVGQELGADLLGVHGGRVVLQLVGQRCAQRAARTDGQTAAM